MPAMPSAKTLIIIAILAAAGLYVWKHGVPFMPAG